MFDLRAKAGAVPAIRGREPGMPAGAASRGAGMKGNLPDIDDLALRHGAELRSRVRGDTVEVLGFLPPDLLTHFGTAEPVHAGHEQGAADDIAQRCPAQVI